MAETRSLRQEVEDFLYAEAALLDAWRLDEWAALFTEDARYVVPTTDLPEGDPRQDLMFIDDDIVRIRARVKRLNSRHAHREYPSSRTRRFISNVRVEETDEGELAVRANALVYRFRSGGGRPVRGALRVPAEARRGRRVQDSLPPSGARPRVADGARGGEHHLLGAGGRASPAELGDQVAPLPSSTDDAGDGGLSVQWRILYVSLCQALNVRVPLTPESPHLYFMRSRRTRIEHSP